MAWLRGLPSLALVGDHLLMHSDTTHYLSWGSTVEEVNATVGGVLGGNNAQAHFDLFADLTARYDFMGDDGPAQVGRMLDTYGGKVLVHGHSIIGSLTGQPSHEVTRPLSYAGGRALAIDGGRYDGGPLLLVPLDPPA